MSTITYLDGSQLTSTALTYAQVQYAFQTITAQMLGLVMFQVNMSLVENSTTVTPASLANLAVGQMLISPNLPVGVPATTITHIGATTITISAPALATVIDNVTVSTTAAADQVRIDWQTEGQPGPALADNTAYVRCIPFDTEYSRMRDVVGSASGNIITKTDVFTRAWKVFWTFYGPNGVDNARAIRSALITIQFVIDFLSGYNLYVNPSIKEPDRVPENIQGRWWERVDVEVDFNEQVNETFTVGTVGSVDVTVYTKDGEFENLEVTT